jgi:uncharacterized protein (DUF1697 family)
MKTFIALLRGINVGKGNRVSMADLRSLFASLGFGRVRTLLASGNVVFDASKGNAETISAQIEAALATTLNLKVRVLVISPGDLDLIIKEIPFGDIADNPSQLLIAFVKNNADLDKLGPLAKQDWTPEIFAVGKHAAYLWCVNGISSGTLAEAAFKLIGNSGTTRNLATAIKLRDTSFTISS